MKTSYHLSSLPKAPGSIVGFITIFIVLFNCSNRPVFAQFRGQDSQQFFDRGNQLMEQQIQQIQQENLEQSQQKIKEQNIESTLEIKENSEVIIEETSSPDNILEKNLPESPENEIEIKTN